MPRRLRAFAAMLLLVSSPALAQDSLPAVTTTRTATVKWLQNLPIDFFEGYFTLEPGVGPAQGGYSLRGGQPYSFATYVDGTPVSAGYRGGAQALLGAAGSPLQLPLSGVTAAAVTTGVLDLGLGNGESGVVSQNTTKGAGRVVGTFDYGTDGLWGAGSSLGLNRMEAGLGGGIGSRFAFSLAGTLLGQTSAAYGPGQRDVPIYRASGIDTTVAIFSTIGDSLADTTFVDVLEFDANSGLRVPSTTTSNYQLLGRMDFAIAGGTGLSFTAAASQDQSRRFDYQNLYNPAQLGAQRAASHAYTLAVTHAFGPMAGPARRLELAVSLQGDQFESGPLSAQGEASSRDPTGGFLVAPLDFRFGLADFPIDEQLVHNVLYNIPGSRRSPYDLENTAQYQLVDQFRNNAYGLQGFSEGGGPTGRLALMQEDRLVGRASLDWALDGRQALRVGGELVSYDLSNYSYSLTSSAFSDVYIEQPDRQAAFAEDRITLGKAVFVVGLRYDHYVTGAERVAGFPRITTNPGFDPGAPDLSAIMTPDEAHSALSPRLQAGFRLNPSTDVRLGIGRQVQMPDMGLSLAGITTDVSVTNSSQVYGSDMGFASTVLAELGGTHQFSPSTSLDAAVYDKQLSGQPVVHLVSAYDPLRGANAEFRQIQSNGDGSVFGAEVRLQQHVGPYFQAFVGYAYQHATSIDVVSFVSRPHTLAGAFGGTLPDRWKAGSFVGSVLQSGGAWATFRFASGAPYTPCPADAGNDAVLSNESCVNGFGSSVNGAHLPSTRQLDLKLARGFGVGATKVTAYVDIRNLLNFDNVTAVYATTGTRESPVLEAQAWTSDSFGYALEASRNGILAGDGSLDLKFAGSGGSGCGNWVTQDGRPSAPNCVYLVRAEQRFGDGDGVFDVAEQRRASNALYNALHGSQLLTGSGRFIRVGFTVGF